MNIAGPEPPRKNHDGEPSLYQQCVTLIEKLYSLPNFDEYLFPHGVSNTVFDPVSVLWNSLRLGAPLCVLFNVLRPRKPLDVVDVVHPPPGGKVSNACKAAVYHFLIACKNELQLGSDEVFTISELYKDDTNGFVKVWFSVYSRKLSSGETLLTRYCVRFSLLKHLF